MWKWTDGLRSGDHVMNPYQDDAERDRARLEIMQWAPREAKLILISDQAPDEGKLTPKTKRWKELKGAGEQDRLEILSAPDFFLNCGVSVGKGVMEAVKGMATSSAQEGYPSMVMVSDLSWLAGRREAFGSFMGFEAALNFAKLPLRTTFLCQYDRRAFSPAELKKACSIHERSLVGRTLERSQWFIPNPNLGERMFV
jgi:hypothetical protein